MSTITICCSASFYRQAQDIKQQLEAMGYKVLIPATAKRMADSGDYDVSHYKTWFGDASDYPKKATLMRDHFDEVSKGDAVLVLNYQKHGVDNYIGGNVLMEMALGFYLRKPIVIFNEVPDKSSFLEEILGMQPALLHGDIAAIKQVPSLDIP